MKKSPHASFKTLALRIEHVARMYFVSKKKIQETDIYSFSSGQADESNPYRIVISKVEHAFEKLDNVDKEFINNDFFLESYPFWWSSIYPKCTYYRYKRKAMVRFLRAYGK